MPTVIFKDDPAQAERLGDMADGYCLRVTHQAEHSRLPAEWKKPIPFEWSGFDDDGCKMLILVSATWSSRELHDFGLARWENLTTSLQERLAREQRRANARCGRESQRKKRADEATERREKIRNLYDTFVENETPRYQIVGKIARRLSLTPKTVRKHLK